MKLSKRGEYGLRALIHLASQADPHAVVPMHQIAQEEQIPDRFLEQILLALSNSGLVQSKKGRSGGYYLGQNSAKITLGEIVRTLDGPLAPIRCVSHMAYEPCACPDIDNCGLRMVMGDVRDAIAAILDNTTLEDVARRQEAARSTEVL